MSFCLSACSNTAEWNQFIAESPQGSVFCYTNFLEALSETYQLYFVSENNRVMAAFPLLLKDGNPLAAPYPFTCYQGILFNPEIEGWPAHRKVPYRLKVLEYILKELSSQYNAIFFCLHPNFEDLRAFLWFNYHEPGKGQFRIDLRYTGILNLQNPTNHEQYMTMVRAVRRQELTRATKEGVTVEDSNDVELLDRLHGLTFERQNINRSASDTRLLGSIAKQSLAENFGKLKLAKTADGTVASAILCLYDRKCAYYLIAANHPDLRKTFASTFLLFHMIDAFRKEEIPCFDFVGINSPNRGDYKVSFNAEPRSYCTIRWGSTN